MENMCKEDLFKFIQNTNFVLIEMALYLDTHPECPCGLETYHDYHHSIKRAIDIYEKKYGPLTIYGVNCKDNWDWVDEPWPWQKGCDC